MKFHNPNIVGLTLREQSKAPLAVIYHGPLNHNGIRPTQSYVIKSPP